MSGAWLRRKVPHPWPPRSLPLDHVLGYARLCDFKSKLKQFPVYARCAPERVLDAHLPDQRAQFSADLRPPSPCPRSPAPVATKPSAMPTNHRRRLNNTEDLQDRRTPAVKLDQEQPIKVGKMHPTAHLAPQHHYLMPQRHILGLKPAPRFERRGQDGPDEADQRDHCPPRLGDSLP